MPDAIALCSMNPLLSARHAEQLAIEILGPAPILTGLRKGLVEGAPVTVPFRVSQAPSTSNNKASNPYISSDLFYEQARKLNAQRPLTH
jgi:hypothetical protein